MNLLEQLYQQKYGGQSKTAAPARPAAAPAPAPAVKTAAKAEALPAEVVREFVGGKVARAAFEDELRKINEETEAQLKKEAAERDPFMQLLKRLG